MKTVNEIVDPFSKKTETASGTKENTLIDLFKLGFAVLIPLLHIGFQDDFVIAFLQQYIARLGVPFFFCTSGLYLAKSIRKKGRVAAFKKFEFRTGKLFAVWLLIYFPLLLPSFMKMGFWKSVQQVVFLSPAYLWYLSASLVAALPFCLVPWRKLLWAVAGILYFFETIFGGGYSWITCEIPLYEKLFLTTRNGIFFALPLFCVGEIALKMKKLSVASCAVTFLLLFVEITIVGARCASDADRSMYLLLPFAILTLTNVLYHSTCQPKLTQSNPQNVRRLSTAIYVLQYGLIFLFSRAVRLAGMAPQDVGFVIYVGVILSAWILYIALRKTKLVNWLL